MVVRKYQNQVNMSFRILNYNKFFNHDEIMKRRLSERSRKIKSASSIQGEHYLAKYLAKYFCTILDLLSLESHNVRPSDVGFILSSPRITFILHITFRDGSECLKNKNKIPPPLTMAHFALF